MSAIEHLRMMTAVENNLLQLSLSARNGVQEQVNEVRQSVEPNVSTKINEDPQQSKAGNNVQEHVDNIHQPVESNVCVKISEDPQQSKTEGKTSEVNSETVPESNTPEKSKKKKNSKRVKIVEPSNTPEKSMKKKNSKSVKIVEPVRDLVVDLDNAKASEVKNEKVQKENAPVKKNSKSTKVVNVVSNSTPAAVDKVEKKKVIYDRNARKKNMKKQKLNKGANGKKDGESKKSQEEEEEEKRERLVEDLKISQRLREKIAQLNTEVVEEPADESSEAVVISSRFLSFKKKSAQEDLGIGNLDLSVLVQDITLDQEFLDEKQKREKSFNFKTMQKRLQKLPVYKKKMAILDLIENNQVVVLTGSTGCGKTTQVPQYILDSYIDANKGSLCKIVCAQQRRICTVGVAERVAKERGIQCGAKQADVGYHISLEKKMPRNKGSILYCTTGILLRQLQSNPNMSGVSHVIVDDAHEHDQLTDFFLMNLHDILAENKDLKLILMSATMNAVEFANYFGDCPTIDIPGRANHVDSFFLEDMIEATGYRPQRKPFMYKGENIPKDPKYEKAKLEYLKKVANKYSAGTIQALHDWNEDGLDLNLIVNLIDWVNYYSQEGTILIFLPGWQEIEMLYREIRRYYNESIVWLIPLHSRTSTQNQRSVLDKAPRGIRKIILSTNIAETSITIDDCTIVIDCGKLKMKTYDPEQNLDILKPQWEAQSNMIQRRGRAGRTQRGVCYHMFTKLKSTMLAEYPIPEMQRTSLEQLILNMKLLKKGDVATYFQKAMHPPTPKAIEASLKILRDVNAITTEEELTPLGWLLAHLPVDVYVGKLLLYGAVFSCLGPILSIAACLTFKDPFTSPIGDSFDLKCQLEKCEKSQSDLLLFAFILQDWVTMRDEYQRKDYAMEYFLSFRILEMLCELRRQYAQYLKQLRFLDMANPFFHDYNINSDNYSLIKGIICAAMYPNVAEVVPTVGRMVLKAITQDQKKVSVYPKSINAFVHDIDTGYLAYHYKMKSSKIFIHNTSAVSVNALLLFCNEVEILTEEDNSFLFIDKWLKVRGTENDMEALLQLRKNLDNVLKGKILRPSVTDWNDGSEEVKVLKTVKEFLSCS